MTDAKRRGRKKQGDEETAPTVDMSGSLKGPGSRIGQFEVKREIGRGGMGVVYLAHDTKLDRPVAIKSLPVELVSAPLVRKRWKREARLLASLNHSNIATIYDELEEAEGTGYLILEYVPGDTLAERIGRKRLKVKESLTIGLQIAEAVAAAHEHGVIHRDLKAGNIKITPEGKVKVLDFGLAKTVGGVAPDQSSTTTTEPGRIIGTPTYMSPEQARGEAADELSDIWSFGCVLYEMLTGKVPFEGGTPSDTLAGILEREPDWQMLPQSTPANIQIMLRRCLTKDPRRRLQHIGDAAIEISETLSGALEAFALPGKVAPVSRLFRRDVILVALVCFIAVVLIIGAFLMSFIRPPKVGDLSRLLIPVPADKPLYTGIAPNRFLAISPDSTCLVYVGELDNEDTELYMRSLDDLQIKPIRGTRNAHNPFFSPNGQWVGFFTEKQLKKVSLVGGEAFTLLEDIPKADAAFGSWADDGTIVFSVHSDSHGLQRISDDGSQQVETLVPPVSEDDEAYYCYPQVLPGGSAILYSHVYSYASRTSHIEAFLPETRKRQDVLDNASYATYVSSGHLIFVRDNVLMAAPFDVEQLKITGPLVPLVNDDVEFDWTGDTPQITISGNGTVVYILGSELRKGELVWVDREGISKPLGANADVYEGPRLSPNGQRIAVGIRSKKDRNIRVNIYNIQLGTFIPLTTECESSYPQWSPDGTRIAFWGRAPWAEEAAVFCKVAGAHAPAERLASKPSTATFLHPYAWSQNLLACTVRDPNNREDIWVVDTYGEQKPKPVLNTEHREYNPIFSPDGHWLAYVSDESGQSEIYLREYPDIRQRWPVPTRGATNPVWSRDGRELYYISDNSMMAVKLTSEPDFPIGAPEPLFELPNVIVSRGRRLVRNYDVSDSNDGRFLMVKRCDDAKDQLVVVRNWFEELKQLAPPRKNK
ncbi:MAG: protein kinase domain-containing protein [Planctomycetota bacterium]